MENKLKSLMSLIKDISIDGKVELYKPNWSEVGLTDLEIRDIFNKFKVPKASGGNDFYFDMIKNKILSTASEISKQRLQ